LVFLKFLSVLQALQDRIGIRAVIGLRIDDDYMDFLMVASQKLAGAIESMLWCIGGCFLRSKSVEGLNLLPTGLEPSPLTSEALVAQNLHGS
jgi:hypothetical protein